MSLQIDTPFLIMGDTASVLPGGGGTPVQSGIVPTTCASGDLIYGLSTNAYTNLPIGSSGQILTVGGTGKPIWGPVITNTPVFSGAIVPNSTQIGQMLKSDGLGNWNILSKSVDGNVLTMQGGDVAWTNINALTWKGAWDASTNTPTISDTTGQNKWWYRATTSGSIDLGHGILNIAVGDDMVHNGIKYEALPGGTAGAQTIYNADSALTTSRILTIGNSKNLKFDGGDSAGFAFTVDKKSTSYSPNVYFYNSLGKMQVSFGANGSIISDIVGSSTIAGLSGNDFSFTTRSGNKFLLGVNNQPDICITTDNNVGVGHINATAKLDIVSSTTSKSSLRIRSGVNPTTPNNGDLWWNGTNLNFYNGSVTKDILKPYTQITELTNNTGISFYSGNNKIFDPSATELNDYKGLVIQASDIVGSGAIINIAATGTEAGNFPSNMKFWTKGNGTEVTLAGTISNTQKWAFGTHTPTAKVDIVGDIKIVDGTQGSGKVLTSDANGLASWQTPAGGSGGASVGDWKAVASAFTSTVTAPWLLAGSTFNTTTYPIFKLKYTSIGYYPVSTTTTGFATQTNPCYAPSISKFVISGNTSDQIALVDPSTGAFTTAALTAATTQRNCAANDTYIWVSEATGTNVYRTTDTTSWTTQNCTSIGGSDKRVYTLGGTSPMVVCHARGGYQVSVSLDNGDTWTSRTLPVSAYYMNSANGKFFIFPSSTNAYIYETTDFITFTPYNTGLSTLYTQIAWNGTRYVLFQNASTNIVRYSNDLSTWNSGTLPATKVWLGLGTTTSNFLAISIDSTQTAKSTDGLSWSSAGFSISPASNLNERPCTNGSNVFFYPQTGGAAASWRITVGYPATGTVPSQPVALTGSSWYIYAG